MTMSGNVIFVNQLVSTKQVIDTHTIISGNSLVWKDSESRKWNIIFQWKLINGTPHPTGISISLIEGEGSITSSLLRELPIGAIIRFDLQHGGARKIYSQSQIQISPETQGPLRGNPLNSNILEQVSLLYRQALQLGTSPTKMISQAYLISESSAAKRIMAARKAGFLGPASPGKKGEFYVSS